MVWHNQLSSSKYFYKLFLKYFVCCWLVRCDVRLVYNEVKLVVELFVSSFLFVCVCVYVCVSVSVLCKCVFMYMFVCMCVYVGMCVWESGCVRVCVHTLEKLRLMGVQFYR